jgi:hypothetical protein
MPMRVNRLKREAIEQVQLAYFIMRRRMLPERCSGPNWLLKVPFSSRRDDVSNQCSPLLAILLKIMDLYSFTGVRLAPNERDFPLYIYFARLPKMKTAIRMFALFVAVSGLVSASISPSAARTTATHRSILVADPDPQPQFPFPQPCKLTGTCFAPVSPAR